MSFHSVLLGLKLYFGHKPKRPRLQHTWSLLFREGLWDSAGEFLDVVPAPLVEEQGSWMCISEILLSGKQKLLHSAELVSSDGPVVTQ